MRGGHVASCLSFLQNDDVSHPVHLRELFAVKRRHQLPGSGLGGDEVLRQCHRGVTSDVTAGGTEDISVGGKKIRRQMRERALFHELTPRPLHGPSAAPGPPLWTALPLAYVAGGWWRWSWLPSPYQLQRPPKAARRSFKNESMT